MDIFKILSVVGSILGILSLAVLIGVYRERINNNTKNIDKIDEKLNSLIEKVDGFSIVKNWIEGMISKNGNAYFRSSSPISLNDKGEKISTFIGTGAIVERLYSTLREKVYTSSPNNPYDIQEKCFKVCENIVTSDLLTSEEVLAIKNYAYEIGVDVNGFHSIFALELRNMIFEKEGHDKNDVDKHDPSLHTSKK